jgi:hypothetical protein
MSAFTPLLGKQQASARQLRRSVYDGVDAPHGIDVPKWSV